MSTVARDKIKKEILTALITQFIAAFEQTWEKNARTGVITFTISNRYVKDGGACWEINEIPRS